MPFKPVLLWTDALLYLLIAVAAVTALYASRREHLRAPWRHILRHRLGMGAFVVLAVYIAVGLVDSVHFRLPLAGQRAKTDGAQTQTEYSSEVLSLLDLLVLPLKERVEKTYSAPFATHLYAKETIERPDGAQLRDFPRLRYGGAHLADPERDRAWDLASTAARALAQGTLAWGALIVLIVAWQTRRTGDPWARVWGRLLRGRTDIPWRVILLTSGALMLFGFLGAGLGMKYHVFGTDKVGSDVLYLSLKSIRTGLVIGTLTTLIMLPFAILLGIMAGYFKGWVDDVIQYVYTTLSSIPAVLLIAAAILTLQAYMALHPERFDTTAVRADARLLFLCIILGITSWTSLCRLLRGETLKLRDVEYIQAATVLGAGPTTIMIRHILPNVMHIVLITVALDFSGLVLAEAVLSYVGVGVDPSTISWGTMINSARLEMAREPMVWWSLASAFTFMFTLVLAANLFSDVVRDAFDPRLAREQPKA
ncbi:MAG: ABC transporter permease [Nitrospirae bacterium]|nr:ABC transporter permease [Nitrospirota bacterium]